MKLNFPLVAIAVCMLVVVGGAVYFFLPRSSSKNTIVASPESSQQSQEGKVVVTLAELNGSGESGTALLEEKDGNVTVSIHTVGYTDKPQPAHIHINNCPGLGTIVYALKNVVNGASVTTLNVTLAKLKQQLPLAVNVHESTDNSKHYVSCGEIAIP